MCNIAQQQTISCRNNPFDLGKMRFLLLKSQAMAEVPAGVYVQLVDYLSTKCKSSPVIVSINALFAQERLFNKVLVL
jgi:hypothetical protein